MDSARAFSQLYVAMWSILNVSIIILLIVMVIRYFRNKNKYQQQVISKLDSILALLQQNKSNDQ